MKLGLQNRVWIGIAAGVALLSFALLASIVVSYNAAFNSAMKSNATETERILSENAGRKAVAISRLAAEALVNHMYYGKFDVIGDFADATLAQDDVVSVRVLAADGMVLHDGTEANTAFGRVGGSEQFGMAIATGTSTFWEKDGLMHAVSPIMFNGEALGAVCIKFDLSTVQRGRAGLQGLLAQFARDGQQQLLLYGALVTLIVGLIAVAVGIAATRGFVRDIASLKSVAHDIGAGRYDDLKFPDREDELGDLATAIARMRDELKATQNRMQYALDETQRASQSKTDFLASMSHELRTPLHAILGYGQLLRDSRREDLSERQLKSVKQIISSGEHLLALIEQVLNMNQIEGGRIEVNIEALDPQEMIERSMQLVKTQFASSTLTFCNSSKPTHLPNIRADETRLVQILVNLLSNAAKYNREDGLVEVKAARIDNDTLRISVRDTGVGIAEEKQKDLFKPFERLGRENGAIEGTGIGLTITKNIAEKIGCTIGFQSTEGVGSTFWVEVPIQVQQAVA